ncbi:MAG: hypothetical protein ABRQ39_18645 [Candidatus Eremiobacterota bacterium]
MKKNISLYENKGIALVMVLSILIILLILSLAIVSLSTGNLRTTGNVRARFEALNLATSAINYNMYDFNHMSASIITPYPPGPTPTPLSSVPVHGPYNVTIDNPSLDMSQASCKYMYAENLSNPNPTTANFAPYVCDPNVPGNTIVIIGEGTYRGYKRVIRAVVRNNTGVAMGMCCDKDADFTSNEGNIVIDPNTKLILNGINDITSAEPVAGSIQANNNLTYYGDANSFKFFNGSNLRAVNTVTAPSIPDKNKVSSAAPVDIQEWDIADIVDIADCNSVPIVSGTPNLNTTQPLGVLDANSAEYLDTSDANQVSYRPEETCLPTPAIPSNKRYVAGNKSASTGNFPTLIVNTDTIVNGNLVVYGNLKLVDGKKLFVNGTLEVKGNLVSGKNITYGGSVITAGYRSGGGVDQGNSLEVKGQVISISRGDAKGAMLFSEGNVYIGNSIPPGNEWLFNQPLNVKATIKALKDTGAENISPVTIGTGGIETWWNANKSKLRNPAIVDPEVVAWFNDPDSDTYMKDSNPGDLFYKKSNNWSAFIKNPSLFNDPNQSFFQGIIYSYGDITVDGPINVIGAVVTVKGTGTKISPFASSSIYTSRGANVVANMEYMVGNKPFYRILTDVLSWCEL